jgi:hypothetical protein
MGQPLTRREALSRIGGGFGMLAFAGLVGRSLAHAGVLAGPDGSLQVTKWHHAPRAKHVIFLFMNGGLSQVDSFDPKPALEKYHGQPLPGGAIATERKTGTLLRSPFTFKKYGQAGMDVSELFPHVGSCADDICFIRSVHTDIPNHEPALLMMNTGHSQVGRPSLGSWLTYGLGTDNHNLPGFVVLCPDVPTTVGPPAWSNAFLPAVHQGTFISDRVGKQDETTLIEKDFDPKALVSYLHNDKFTLAEQRRELALMQQLERVRPQAAETRDPQLEAALQSMEIAYRMQTEAPDVFDIRKETEATLKLYGPGHTARGCLMAVRLVERGVRMVQLYYAKGDPWDAHADIQAHRRNAKDSDQPYAAVIKDLKSRGLLDETLVVCGSEFGRTPVVEIGGGVSTQNGRDHNPFGFTMWLAGGGVKGGIIHGATDDFGFKAVDKPVHVHDLHATILHLMGIDHTKLTYQYSGRDFRLTDVAGNVLHEILK